MHKHLGLAYRARKLTIGTQMTIESMRNQQVYLVLLASDASDLTKKKILDKAHFYHVKVIEDMSTKQLSDAIGKLGIKVIGVTDRGFSQLLSS